MSSPRTLDNRKLRGIFEWLTSGRTILWIFASSVFGAYVVSLIAALCESIGYYGPMRVFTTGGLANMVLPFQISIYVWIIASVLLLLGQLRFKPIHRDTILIGAGSLAVSLLSQWTVGASLLGEKVPWFVSYLGLTSETKLLVGIVAGFALIYVVLSPLVWRTKPTKEIADELKGRVLNKMLDDVERYLGEQYSRRTDRSEIQTHDVSFYVDMISIAVSALCTTPDAKRVSYYGIFSLPRLEPMTTEIGPYRDGHYRAGEDRGGEEIIRGRKIGTT